MGVLQAILHKWYVIYLQLPTTYDIIYQAVSYRLYYLYFKFKHLAAIFRKKCSA